MSVLKSVLARPKRGHRVTLGGVAVDMLAAEEVLDAVRGRLTATTGRPLCLGSANLDHIEHFGPASGRQHVMAGSDVDWLVLLDGMPLVWMANRLTGQPQEQLAGSDLLPAVLAVAAKMRSRVGLLGGSVEMHEQFCSVCDLHFEGLRIVGTWAPSRQQVQDAAAAERLAHEIRDLGVELLIVGLGKPRQECWLASHAVASDIKVGVAFGAAGDFLTGAVKRAPLAWRRAGLEWLYRLVHEPRRLGARYLVHGPRNAVRLIGDSRSDHAAPDTSVSPGQPFRPDSRAGRGTAA